ncbi:unnamed protein product [Blepharisma stoltei]|uniref:Uncharacterized protein n=1 Tax=Blepharisma stoltei TaxID=1481888 RepID=A0AAU9JMT5_9CILI|nr:unnamed protein product [Blepharisma stoltei]
MLNAYFVYKRVRGQELWTSDVITTTLPLSLYIKLFVNKINYNFDQINSIKMTEIPRYFFVFKTVTKADTTALLDEKLVDESRSRLAQIFDLLNNDEKSQILLDFHELNLKFCIRERFSEEKTSTVLGIFNYALSKAIEGALSRSACFEIFKKLLLKHSVERSPYSIAVFTLDDLKKVLDFALCTFFQYYSLYEYIFTPHTDLSLRVVSRFEGRFPLVLPLSEGSQADANNIAVLDPYIEKPIEEEAPAEENPEEEEDPMADPLQYLLNMEMKAIKAELEEKIKKQDDEFLSKLDSFKR